MLESEWVRPGIVRTPSGTGESYLQFVEDFQELPSRVVERAGVVDCEIGRRPLLCQRELACFTAVEVGRRPAATGDAGLTLFDRCVYKNDGVAEVVPAGFEEHCRVQQDQIAVVRRLNLLPQVPPDDWMDDLFQVVTGLAVFVVLTKHQFGQSVPANVLP